MTRVRAFIIRSISTIFILFAFFSGSNAQLTVDPACDPNVVDELVGCIQEKVCSQGNQFDLSSLQDENTVLALTECTDIAANSNCQIDPAALDFFSVCSINVEEVQNTISSTPAVSDNNNERKGSESNALAHQAAIATILHTIGFAVVIGMLHVI